MPEKNCPDCGNPNTESQTDALGNTFYLCPVCNNKFESRSGLFEVLTGLHPPIKEIATRGKEWIDYAREYGIEDFNIWEMFLWKDKGIDVSDENIKRCQRLYEENPNDKDNLLRILVLKILAGKDYKDLASKFVLFWRRRELHSNFFCWEFFDSIDFENLLKLKPFLLGLMEVNPAQFKDEANTEYAFSRYSAVVGTSNLSALIDPERQLLENFNFRWDDEYLKYYALAKFFYSEKRWFDAFCLFAKLKIFNIRLKVTNDELLEFELEHYHDILCASPTIEEIEAKAEECFLNITDKAEQKRLYTLINYLHGYVWINYDEAKDRENQVDSYLNTYNHLVELLNELVLSNYAVAFSKWEAWDKSGKKMLGLDVLEITNRLRDLKDGIGDKDKILKNLSLGNPFIEDFALISSFGMKLREFIAENLKKFYGSTRKAIFDGIPKELKVTIPVKNDETEFFSYLDFSHYVPIMRVKDNWKNIFRKYFIFNKEDNNKSCGELVAFIWDVVELRHIVAHYSRPLNEEERKKVRSGVELFNKIYERWKYEGAKNA
ncbi:MAG TPA: hypothetical protein DCL35_00180 [Candidatus Omnitrophica bacterium]|nr:hypothetical protein [Candidatus Omnitrophota bacterium]